MNNYARKLIVTLMPGLLLACFPTRVHAEIVTRPQQITKRQMVLGGIGVVALVGVVGYYTNWFGFSKKNAPAPQNDEQKEIKKEEIQKPTEIQKSTALTNVPGNTISSMQQPVRHIVVVGKTGSITDVTVSPKETETDIAEEIKPIEQKNPGTQDKSDKTPSEKFRDFVRTNILRKP